jgi:hypothetical protein
MTPYPHADDDQLVDVHHENRAEAAAQWRRAMMLAATLEPRSIEEQMETCPSLSAMRTE